MKYTPTIINLHYYILIYLVNRSINLFNPSIYLVNRLIDQFDPKNIITIYQSISSIDQSINLILDIALLSINLSSQ